MFDLIATLLAWFYSLVPDYGVAIVLLTLTVMIVVTPLTLKGTRSMLQMQRLQPELKRIQNRYRDDRQKMNEEMMKFYQENGINPLGGCLPLFVQLPVFLVLFRVLRGLTARVTDIGTQVGWTAGRAAIGGPFDVEPLPRTEHPFDPQYLDPGTRLYQDLHGSTEMTSWGIDLSRSASDVVRESLTAGLPYLVLILVVLVTGLYQQRQIQGRNTGTQVNPQQQMIMKIMPFFLPVFSYTMPAGLVIYFVVSNLYRIGQQAYITRSLYHGEDSLGAQARKARADAIEVDGKTGGKGTGGGTKTAAGGGKKAGKAKKSRSGGKGGAGGTGSKKTGASGKGTTGGGARGAGRTGRAPRRTGRVTPPGTRSRSGRSGRRR